MTQFDAARFAEHKDRLVGILRAAHRGAESFDEEGARRGLDVAAELVLRWKREELSPKELAVRRLVEENRGRLAPIVEELRKATGSGEREAWVTALQLELERLSGELDRMPAPRGRPPDRGRRIFAVNTLSMIYRHLTGRKPGISRIGPFNRFVSTFLAAIGDTDKRGHALGEDRIYQIIQAAEIRPPQDLTADGGC